MFIFQSCVSHNLVFPTFDGTEVFKMSLKKQTSELDVKLKALRLRIKKCDQIIENRNKQTMERQCISLVSLAREKDQLRSRLNPGDKVFSGRVRRKRAEFVSGR